MGFPIPYAGILPKLLFTAAISMAAIRDLCISLLESLGIITMGPSHDYTISNQINHNNNHSASIFNDYPSQWYFNPHLHAPADHPLFIHRSAFVEAVQASLPAVLYESLLLKCQECAADTTQSLPSSSSELADLSLTSSSSSLCSTAYSHKRSGALATAHNLQINRQKPLMSARSSAANIAKAEAHISQYDHRQGHQLSAPTMPCTCGATAASSHADDHLQQRTSASELQKQAQSPVSACVQEEGAAGNSYGSHYHLQQLRAECAVCLCEFERGEEVRELPSCRHVFHKDCIDGWILHNHRTCPLCRTSLLTPAMELQEKMREAQELSDQVTSWFIFLEQEEGAAYQDHYLQNLDHNQGSYYTLQPAAGN